MAPPQLMDELIGNILTQLQPGEVEGLFQVENADTKTLKTCSLVSRQFAFWSRRNPYRKLDIKGPQHVSHYLSLLRRYTDMESHIQILTVIITENYGTGTGHEDLISILDLLAQKGAVIRAEFFFGKVWDYLKLELQISIMRFILSRTFECLSLEGTCLCFPMGSLPIPWLAKRFFINHLWFEVIPDGLGNYRVVCPQREKACKAKGITPEGNGVHPLVGEAILTRIRHLFDVGILHPEKTTLKSLWMPSEATISVVRHLRKKLANGCIHTLRELHFFGLYDRFILEAVSLIRECKDTLESLGFMDLDVYSATSSYLRLLTDIELPRLHTLTMVTHMKPVGEVDEANKSLAWYLLHTAKLKRFSLKSLNILAAYKTPPTTVEMVGGVAFISKLFDFFDFFELEKAVTGLLVPDTGKLGVWVLMGTPPGQSDTEIVEKRMQTNFADLYRAGRAEGMVGMLRETTRIADALSIFPEGSAITGRNGVTAL